MLPILRHLSTRSRLVIAFAVGLVAVVFLLDFRTRARLVRGSFPDAADRYYLPPPTYLRMASLGYQEAAADLVWVAAIQHAADRRLVAGRRFPWLEAYLDAVLALNPYMLKVYLWADGTLTYARGNMRQRDWLRAIHYLEIGHRHFPRNWELLFKLSCAYTELRSKNADQRSRWMRRAADYLWKAHLVGGGPPWLGSLAARYWSEEGQWMLAYRRTLEEFKATDNKAVRQQMADRLANLLARNASSHSRVASYARLTVPTVGNPGAIGLYLLGETLQRHRVFQESEHRVQQVAKQQKAFHRAYRRCLPYASSDLYVLLGPCPTPASDPGVDPESRKREQLLPPPPRPHARTRPAPRVRPRPRP